MKHKKIFFFFLFTLSSLKTYCQKENFEHYFSTREFLSCIYHDENFYWQNSLGIYSKNINEDKVNVIDKFRSIEFDLLGLDVDKSLIAYNHIQREIRTFRNNQWDKVDTLKRHIVNIFHVDNAQNQYFMFGADTLIIKSKSQTKTYNKIGLKFEKNEFIFGYNIHSEDNICLKTNFDNIFYFNKAQGKFVQIDSTPFTSYIGRGLSISVVAIDGNKNVWFGSYVKDIIGRYNIESSTWTFYNHGENNQIGTASKIHVEDNNDVIFMSGMSNVLKYKSSNSTWEWFSGFSKGDFKPISYIGNGLVITSDYKLDSLKSNPESKKKKLINDIYPIYSNRVGRIFKDSDNSIWFSDYYFYNLKNEVWSSIDSKELGSYSNKYITDFAIDKDGNRWFATSAGLMRYNNGDWYVYDRTNLFKGDDFIESIEIDKYNTFWVCTKSDLFILENDSLIKIELKDKRQYEKVNKIIEDKNGNVFLRSTDLGKWYKYDNKNWNTIFYKDVNKWIRDLYKDDEGNLYFAYKDTIYQYHNDKVSKVNFKMPTLKNTYLKYFKVIKGELWLFYANNIIVKSTSKKLKYFKNPARCNNITADFYDSFLIDEYEVWSGGNCGLYHFSLKNLIEISNKTIK